ncbi:MAG: hypothetical protein ACKVU1_15720 [bacterium]
MSRLRDASRWRWLRRAGKFGFAFFLIKGLVWLAAAGWIASAFDCDGDDAAIARRADEHAPRDEAEFSQ